MPEATHPQVPLVSVVIPTYQRPKFLGRAIESVLKQTYQNWELLVVDDNEPDSEARRETEAFMRRFESDARVRYLKHESNKGGAAARNTGIEQARGEYVAFLDDDDEWLSEKLSLQVRELLNSSKAVSVFSGARVITSTGNERYEHLPPYAQGEIFPAILAFNFVGSTSAVLCRRRALELIGGFDATLPSAQDMDLYIRLARLGEFRVVELPLFVRHEHAAERITHHRLGKVRAFERLYAKYRQDYQRYPDLHSRFLFDYAKRLLEAQKSKLACREFYRAWCVNPRNIKALGYLGLAILGYNRYERIRLLTLPFRHVLKRMLGIHKHTGSLDRAINRLS